MAEYERLSHEGGKLNELVQEIAVFTTMTKGKATNRLSRGGGKLNDYAEEDYRLRGNDDRESNEIKVSAMTLWKHEPSFLRRQETQWG